MPDFPALLASMEGAFYGAFGEAATYTAPGAAEGVSCTVIRVGGAREVWVGPMRFTVDDTDFHVSRAALTPEAGALITIGGQTWTVGAVEPLARDATALTWVCRGKWGFPAVWHRVTGAGSEQSPIVGGPWTVDGAHSGGAASLSLSAPYAVGALVAGDVLTVDGTPYTVTARSAASGGAVVASITPALGSALAGGEGVSVAPINAAPVRIAPAEWSAAEMAAGVATDDRRFILRAAGLSWTPSGADQVLLPEEEAPMPVRKVEAVWSGEDIAAYVVTVAR